MEKEKKTFRGHFEPIVDTLGEILAFFTIALILLLYINGNWAFISPKATEVLAYIREIAIIVVIALSGLEFALKGHWIRTIIFIVLLAGVIVFMFFPESVPQWATP
jgi:predicted acyltransferase